MEEKEVSKRGAKVGENRFKASQIAKTTYRANRLSEVVLPKLKSLSNYSSIRSINNFCSVAADLYNENLPINENPIAKRVLKQNNKYWSILEPVYYNCFQEKDDLEKFKLSSVYNINENKIHELEYQLKRLDNENKVLRSALSGDQIQKQIKIENIDSVECLKRDIENMGKLIELLIDKYGVINIDFDKGAIRDLSDDLEEAEGILPANVVESYIKWLKNKCKKISG